VRCVSRSRRRFWAKKRRFRLDFAGNFPHPCRRGRRRNRGRGRRNAATGVWRLDKSLREESERIMALTKAEMAEALFNQLGLNKREARELVDLFFEEVRAALAQGEQVKLSGFGNFDLRDKNQRPGRNPKTGEEI